MEGEEEEERTVPSHGGSESHPLRFHSGGIFSRPRLPDSGSVWFPESERGSAAGSRLVFVLQEEIKRKKEV